MTAERSSVPVSMSARTLPARDYSDPSVHEVERTAIFGREWLCLGPSGSVAEIGSYVAESVVVHPALARAIDTSSY